MANKLTTVEWLLENLNFEPYDEEEFKFNDRIWEQAKAMDKENIMMAYNDGRINQGLKQNKNSKQYYEQTYGDIQGTE